MKMVKFNLKKENENEEIYEYYPEGNSYKGLISKNKATGIIDVRKPAKNDTFVLVSKEDSKMMIDAINEIRAENGEKPLEEEPNELRFYKYALHAMKEIEKGKKEGAVVWY